MVRGELGALRAAIDSQFGVTSIVLDLGGVSTIDAGGLGVMLELRDQARARSIEFKLMNVSKFVAWVLEVTRLNSVFEVMSGAELYFPLRSQAEPMTLAACA